MYERIQYNIYEPGVAEAKVDPVLLDDFAHILTGSVLFMPVPERDPYFTRHQGAAVLALMPEVEDSRFAIPTEAEFNANQNQFALAA